MMTRRSISLCTWFAALTVAALACRCPAADYQVGPGQTYTRVVDVPWESLAPGDSVYIHWRSVAQGGDYHEKVNLTASGTAAKPIQIIGVPGPNGERPCLNGANAITRTVNPAQNSTYYVGNQDRGVLNFSETNGGPWQGHGADYWNVSGLKITGARPANDYTNSFGQLSNYQRTVGGLGSAAAGVFIDRGNYLSFSNMELTDNNNGFFASSDNYGAVSRQVHDITLQNSRLYGNGEAGNWSVHNSYVEVANYTVRNNYFGPLVPGSMGTHIKDRGANVLIEGNFFHDANTTMYLVPPEYSMGWMENQPGFGKITVRNNVIYKPDSATYNGQDLILTGFDTNLPIVRTVDVTNNTFLLASSQNSAWGVNLFNVSSQPQVINFDKNVLLRYVGAGLTPSELRLVAKFSPATADTILNLTADDYLSGQATIMQQTSGQYSNGTVTVNGFANLNLLANLTQAQLEALLGINLHDPTAANFGRFDAATNTWFLAHQAGATVVPEPAALALLALAGAAMLRRRR